MTAYTVSKAGVNMLVRNTADELGSLGVRVNAVSPGIIKTPMHAEATHDFLATLHPVGRMGDPEEVAQGVLYLEDAGFVTGEILHVDGGAHMGKW